MRKLLSALTLVAAIAAPAALHATPISGQFSIDSTVTNNGSTLTFLPGPSGLGSAHSWIPSSSWFQTTRR